MSLHPTETGTPGVPDETGRIVTFYDSYRPALPGGSYRITVAHTVADGGTTLAEFDAAQDFDVRAPRFSLDPGMIHSCGPAAGARGDFGDQLPHLTLDRATLPWEQQVDDTSRAPWVALLLFAEGERGEQPQDTGTAMTVRALLSSGTEQVRVPDIDAATVLPDVLDSTCRCIDVPTGLFTAIAPRPADLDYLAHIREVGDPASLRSRPGVGAGLAEELDAGRYSVVVGNRFPRTAGGYTAHLVSLEGFRACLDGTPPSQATLRMVSLWSWSFRHDPGTPDDDTLFYDLMTRIAAPGKDDPSALALRLPPQNGAVVRSAVEQEAADRLAHGYVPVTSHTPTGERTYAWYRGPFTPVPAQPVDTIPAPLTSADQALVYLREYGVFDVGYASAWTLGQTLALADADTAATVSRTRRELRAATTRFLRRVAVHGVPEPGQARTLWDGHPARQRFHELLAADWGEHALRRLAAPGGNDHPVSASPPARPSAALPGRDDVHALLGRDDVRALLGDLVAEHTAPLAPLTDPLGLLAALPFDALVADARMLPAESIRFFHVDPLWLRALADGVLSTGVVTSLDAHLHTVVHARLAAGRRAEDVPKAGFLLRSRLVRDMPGLTVEGSAGDGPSFAPVYRANPAPDLLLCLFAEVPDDVVIAEPHHGLSYGIDADDRIGLRHLTDRNGQPGASIPDAALTDVSRFLRTGGAGVLNIADGDAKTALVPALAASLTGLGELTGSLTPADYALELLNTPYRIAFRHAEERQP
ncbi:hypothetical protein ACFU6K_14880 [Kitasatospora sp. NPDC057512]|uniref:hypothetical protein n=1 Tax=Kitasatospora sp. NPDC057512 TaxID=3346154 RepID=UPI0036762FEA